MGTAIEVLKTEFIERRRRNQKYSLRSFARDLHISPGQLSRIFNQQRNLTPKQAARIAAALQWSKTESKRLVDQAVLSAPPRAKVSRSLRKRVENEALSMNHLTIERFKTISHWYHLPILEMTYLEGFKNDENWISKQLGISTIEVRDAITRLLNLGLLERCPEKGVKKSNARIFIDSHSEPEIRQFQKAMIDKSVTLLQKSTTEEMKEMLINSITFPISQKKIPELREEIFKFQRKIMKWIRDDQFDDVYQLNCQLFPLTKPKRGNK